MSQKGEDFDFSFKNAQNSTQITGSQQAHPTSASAQFPPPPAPASTLSSQFNPSAAAAASAAVPPVPPPPPQPNPAMYWDYWNTSAPFYGVPNSSFDFNIADKSGMFNQAYPAQATNTKPSASTSGAGAASTSKAMMPPPSQPPAAPMTPFMDPSYLFYAHHMQAMAAAYAAAAQYGAYPPYGMGMLPGAMPFGPRQLPDDQQSIQSYHFDMDTRSEKKMPLLVNARAQSIAGEPVGGFKAEPMDAKMKPATGLLLMEDPSAGIETQPTGLIESSVSMPGGGSGAVGRPRDENRMTPLTHQLPHVRASFALNAMVKVRANDPCEGQPALVDIINLGDVMEHFLSHLKSMKTTEAELGNDLLNEDYDPNANDISDDMRNEILTNYKLMQEFPGPLVKETTSKAQVIQFCQKNVKECLSSSNVNVIDPQSHALLWDYLALLVRQNGIFDLKTDISPLLLSGIADSSTTTSHSSQTPVGGGNGSKQSGTIAMPPQIKQSASSSSLIQQQQDFVLVNNEDPAGGNGQVDSKPVVLAPPVQASLVSDEEMHLNKLRQLLGAGQKTDAIDLAIKHNMWPHALFLASSFSSSAAAASTTVNLAASSTNVNSAAAAAAAQQQMEPKLLHKVKIRFINSLQPNDPIQTCYQLLIGKVPSIASNVAKAEWNDWRRHLAMIVSNVDDFNRDLVYTTIKTMGDSLASNGRVAASHFCYLLSNCAFGTFNKKSSKLVLIGSSHNQEYSKFCQISAIQATEVYEFANSLCTTKSPLSPSGILEHFVKYKLVYATRLIEFGLVNEAFKYIEVIAKSINLNSKLHADKISPVFHLANRLRVYDPDFNTSDDGSNLNAAEPLWLQELSNNFKKQHLSKLWHLLPDNRASDNSTPTSQAIAAQPSNQTTAVSNSIAEQQQHYQQQQQQQHHTAPIMEPPQAPAQYQAQYQQHPGPDLTMANLNLNATSNQYEHQPQYEHSQSMPFVPAQPVEHTFQPQEQQPQQPIEHHPQYYYHSQGGQQVDAQPQQHQQNHSYFNPSQTNVEMSGQQAPPSMSQSRKSSVASAYSPADYSTSQFYHPPQQSHERPPLSHVKPRNASTSSSAAVTSVGVDNTGYDQSRSREGSVSTTAAAANFTPFNPYNPAVQKSETSYFDPSHQSSAHNIPKSQTFPIQQTQQAPPEFKEEPVSSDELNAQAPTNKPKKPYYFDDDDGDQAAGNKPAGDPNAAKMGSKGGQLQDQPNKSWLGRALGYIKPANVPKKMILPDDRHKTIVWDDKLKRYVNKDSSGGDASSEAVKPPPLMPMLTQNPAATASTPNMAALPAAAEAKPPNPLASESQNRFSLKSAASKQNYYSKLDYFASSDPSKRAAVSEAAAVPALSHMPPPSQIPPRFFVPEPAAAAPQDTQPHAQGSSEPANSQMLIPNNQDYYEHQQQQQQASHFYQPGQYYGASGDNHSDETDTATTSNNESAPASSNDSGSSSSYNHHYQGYDAQVGSYQHFHSNI